MHPQIDRRRAERRTGDRRAGLVTDLHVGESLALEVPHGTGIVVLTVTLTAKVVGLSPDVDAGETSIRMDIDHKPGQKIRTVLAAPGSVRVAKNSA